MPRTVSTWCANRQTYTHASGGCLYRAHHGDLYVTMHLVNEANHPPRRIIRWDAPIESLDVFDEALDRGKRDSLRYTPVKTSDPFCAEAT